jgi:hypothetical protein
MASSCFAELHVDQVAVERRIRHHHNLDCHRALAWAVLVANLRSSGSRFELVVVGEVGFWDLVHLDPFATSGLQAHIHCQTDNCQGRYPSVDDRLEEREGDG